MGLIAYYRMNGNSNDASGNGFNGTDTNITYSQPNGVLNGGAAFNGTSSKINLGTLFSLSSAMTISFLMKHNSWGGGPYLADSITNGNWGQWAITYNFISASNAISLIWENGSGTNAAYEGVVSITNDKWYHVVVTRDSSRNPAIYLDSKKITASFVIGSNAVGVAANPNQIYIGTRAASSNPYWFKGSQDEVKFNNDSWPVAGVKNEYARIKGFF